MYYTTSLAGGYNFKINRGKLYFLAIIANKKPTVILSVCLIEGLNRESLFGVV
tara:strand:- start:231 stop:389 length:159 start_codon:yes stop_codon:yes gene_type:complete